MGRNISKEQREKILSYLDEIKKKTRVSDVETILKINEIERHIDAETYGIIFEKHSEDVFRVSSASGSISAPASVRLTLCDERSKSWHPNSSSSCLICWESVPGVMNSDLDASEKLRVLATVTKYRICLNSIVNPFFAMIDINIDNANSRY